MRRFICLILVLIAADLSLRAWAGPNDANPVANGTSVEDVGKATEAAHPDWSVTDKAGPAMAQILSAALEGFSNYKPSDPCKGAAAALAWYILSDAANGAPLAAFLDAISGALGKIKTIATFGADPEAAADAAEAGKMAEEYAKTLKDEGVDAVKKKLKDLWEGKKKEVFKTAGTKAGCDFVLYSVWDRAAGTYDIFIYGHCKCAQMSGWDLGSSGPQLEAWSVHLTGNVSPAKSGGQWVYNVGPPKVVVDANCKACNAGKRPVKPLGGGSSTAPQVPGGGGTSTPPPPPPQDVDWSARKTCVECQPILDQLIQAQKDREKVRLQLSDASGQIDAAITRHDAVEEAAWNRVGQTLRSKDADLIAKMADLAKQLENCKCGHASLTCPKPKEEYAMSIGPNSAVGSGARATDKALGTAMGVLGGFMGGGGSGGGGSKGPHLASCHIQDTDMTLFDDPETGVALRVGAKRSGDDVTVFASVDKSPDSGTFQTAYLQNAAGEREAPKDVNICKLWGEWSISVSWTKTTYVDNKVVDRQSGGWSKSGDFNLPGTVSSADAPDGMWKRLGFSNASHGAREVAMSYAAPQAALTQPVSLVIHATQPDKDPVTTVPFVIQMTETPGGFTFARLDRTPCPGGDVQ